MTGTDLDDILTQVDCPSCGKKIVIPFRQVRIQRAAGCFCGALIILEDATMIAEVQALINETKTIEAAND